MISKQFTEPTVAIDHVGYEEDYDYGQIGKGVAHASVVPFLIGIWFPAYALIYLLCAAFLYGTVFRHKSQPFFGTLLFEICIGAMMIVPN